MAEAGPIGKGDGWVNWSGLATTPEVLANLVSERLDHLLTSQAGPLGTLKLGFHESEKAPMPVCTRYPVREQPSLPFFGI